MMLEKKLPAIIEEIIAGLETVEVVPPTAEVEENQHVVGVLPEELQRLAGLWHKAGVEFNELSEKLQAEIDGIDSRAAQEEAYNKACETLAIANLKYEEIKRLFWDSTRLAFPELLKKGTIGLAKDFQVYWQDDSDDAECEFCGLRHGSFSEILGARIIGPIRLPGLGALLNAIVTQTRDEQQTPEGEEQPPESEEEPTGVESHPGDGSQHV